MGRHLHYKKRRRFMKRKSDEISSEPDIAKNILAQRPDAGAETDALPTQRAKAKISIENWPQLAKHGSPLHSISRMMRELAIFEEECRSEDNFKALVLALAAWGKDFAADFWTAE